MSDHIDAETCAKYAEICEYRNSRSMDIAEGVLYKSLARICRQASDYDALRQRLAVEISKRKEAEQSAYSGAARLAEAEAALRMIATYRAEDGQCDNGYSPGHADQPTVNVCSQCGGSGVIYWRRYDGTEEGCEEQDPCPSCTPDKPTEGA